uniref:molybdopterin-dependent oxidoreductase n=1 Tax=Salmonella enterica TaxID=28901 RepID=UPI00398C6DDC
ARGGGGLTVTVPGEEDGKVTVNREKLAKGWGVERRRAHTGDGSSERPHREAHGEVRAAYIMGEDPMQTDAELSAVRKAFEDQELVNVQDIFMTKNSSTAEVVLFSSARGAFQAVSCAVHLVLLPVFSSVCPE